MQMSSKNATQERSRSVMRECPTRFSQSLRHSIFLVLGFGLNLIPFLSSFSLLTFRPFFSVLLYIRTLLFPRVT